MKIVAVSARVRNAAESAAFYSDVLDLPVEKEADLMVVTVGATRLELIEDRAAEGDHHFAITIPSDKFVEAKKWITGRTGLLGVDGADEFECSPTWNAHSLYFSGPDRSVVEFIVRRDLAAATTGPFTSADLLYLSEVGVAVPDVLTTVAMLHDDADVAPYGGPPDADFAPVGDTDGLLILVAPGRTWFPTAERVARESQLWITAIGGRPGDYMLGNLCSLRILPEGH